MLGNAQFLPQLRPHFRNLVYSHSLLHPVRFSHGQDWSTSCFLSHGCCLPCSFYLLHTCNVDLHVLYARCCAFTVTSIQLLDSDRCDSFTGRPVFRTSFLPFAQLRYRYNTINILGVLPNAKCNLHYVAVLCVWCRMLLYVVCRRYSMFIMVFDEIRKFWMRRTSYSHTNEVTGQSVRHAGWLERNSYY